MFGWMCGIYNFLRGLFWICGGLLGPQLEDVGGYVKLFLYRLGGFLGCLLGDCFMFVFSYEFDSYVFCYLLNI